jgi:hypothetical protein
MKLTEWEQEASEMTLVELSERIDAIETLMAWPSFESFAGIKTLRVILGEEQRKRFLAKHPGIAVGSSVAS